MAKAEHALRRVLDDHFTAQRRDKTAYALTWVLLLTLLGLMLVPLLFMALASFMPTREIFSRPFAWIPHSLYFGNYVTAIRGNHEDYIFLVALMNSVIVVGVITLLTVFLASLTGYSLAKLPFPGRNLVFVLILSSIMLPFETIMIPLYLVIRTLNIQNTYMGLIAPFMLTPLGVFLMRQTFIPFPEQILDTARIDGAKEIAIFSRVVMPNALPAMAVLGVLTIQQQWDNLIWPLLVVQDRMLETLPLYLVTFAEERYTDEGALIATAALASIPLLAMLFFLADHFLKGAHMMSGQKE